MVMMTSVMGDDDDDDDCSQRIGGEGKRVEDSSPGEE